MVISITVLLLITFETIWQKVCSLYLLCCFAWTTFSPREFNMDHEFASNLGADRMRRRSGLRGRRTMSSSKAEGIVTAELRARRLQPDRPIHRPTDSLLSWTKQVGCRQGIGWLATQEAIKAIRIRSLALPNYHALQPEQAVDEIY